MNDHTHKLGIIIKPYVTVGCVECDKRFPVLQAMDYLDLMLGREEGMRYWRILREKRDQMRREWKQGVRFEGTWYPPDLKQRHKGVPLLLILLEKK